MHCLDHLDRRRWAPVHACLRIITPSSAASVARARLDRANDEPTMATGAAGTPHTELLIPQDGCTVTVASSVVTDVRRDIGFPPDHRHRGSSSAYRPG